MKADCLLPGPRSGFMHMDNPLTSTNMGWAQRPRQAPRFNSELTFHRLCGLDQVPKALCPSAAHLPTGLDVS